MKYQTATQSGVVYFSAVKVDLSKGLEASCTYLFNIKSRTRFFNYSFFTRTTELKMNRMLIFFSNITIQIRVQYFF